MLVDFRSNHRHHVTGLNELLQTLLNLGNFLKVGVFNVV